MAPKAFRRNAGISIPSAPSKGNPGSAWIGNPGIAFVADRRYMGCQSGVLLMERDMELRIKGHLFEILEVDNEIIGNRQGQQSSKDGFSDTLESVASCGNAELVDQVAEDIKQHIRSREERPRNQNVRIDARKLLVSEGFLPDEYLNSA